MSTLLEKHIVELLAERNEKAISLLYDNYSDTLFAIDKLRSISTKSDKEIQIDVSDVYNLGVEGVRPDLMDVQEHLDKIEPKYQIVLDALFFQGMTQQEASEELDIPLGTVKSRLKIGLRELRKVYGTSFVILFILTILL